MESASSCGVDQPGRWLIGWRVQNVGREPIEILSVWLPHDKFASGQQVLNHPIHLLPTETRLLEVGDFRRGQAAADLGQDHRAEARHHDPF